LIATANIEGQFVGVIFLIHPDDHIPDQQDGVIQFGVILPFPLRGAHHRGSSVFQDCANGGGDVTGVTPLTPCSRIRRHSHSSLNSDNMLRAGLLHNTSNKPYAPCCRITSAARRIACVAGALGSCIVVEQNNIPPSVQIDCRT
jgi:hypothetical protein